MTPTARLLTEVTAPPPEPEYNPAPDFTAEDYPAPQPPPPELPAWQGEAWERMAPDTWSGGPSGGSLPPGFSAAPPMENWDPAQQVQPTGRPWEPSSNPYFGGGATATDVGYQTTRVADRAQLDPWGQPYADEYAPPPDYGRVEGAEYAYATEGRPDPSMFAPTEELPADPSQYQVEGFDPWEEGDIRAGRPTGGLGAAARGIYDLGKGYVESQQVLEMPDELAQQNFGKDYGELTEVEREIIRRQEMAKPFGAPPEALELMIGNIGGAGAGDDFARQLQKSLSIGKKGGKEALNAATAPQTSTVAEMRQALTDAGRDSTGNRSAIIARYRGLEAEQVGGIGTPNENVSNAARTSYGDVLERSGDPEAARLAGRRSAAQEQQANRNAGEMSARMDQERAIFGSAVDDLPPIGGGAAMPNLTTRQVDEISHFADMTRGVIDDHSTMQRLYNSARPVTAKITGDVPDSVVAELLSREAELGTMLLRSGADPDDIAHTVDLFTGDMLKGRFKNDPARLKAAQTEITARRKAFFDGQGDLEKGVDAVSDLMRAGMLAGDVSLFGVQLLAAGRRGLVPILVGTANRIATQLHMPGMVQVYLRNDIDRVAQYIAAGGQMGAGAADISKGTMLNKIGLDQIPVLKKLPGAKIANVGTIMDSLTTLQYDWILSTVRLRAFEGQMVIAKLMGSDIADPLVQRHIAEYTSTIGSTARPATGMKRAKGERMGLLTARMTRAGISEVITPLRSLRSREDALNTASLISSFAIMLGAGKALNDQFGVGDFGMDPRDPGTFGRVTLRARGPDGRRRVVDIFPQFAFPRALMKSVAAFNESDMNALADAWERYGIGRLNVVPAMMARIGGYGYDTTGGFHKGDMPMEERAKGNLPIPLSWRDAVLKGETNPTDLALDMTGVSQFPESTTGVKNQLAAEYAGKPDPRGGTYPEGVKFDGLAPTDQKKVNASEEVNASAEATPDSRYQKRKSEVMGDIDRQEAAIWESHKRGDMDRSLSDALREVSTKRQAKREDLASQFAKDFSKYDRDAFDKAIEGYYKETVSTTTGGVDWDATEAARNRYVAGLPANVRAHIENFLEAGKPDDTTDAGKRRIYFDKKEALGYYKPGITQGERAKLDKANPEIDYQNWYYGSGVVRDGKPVAGQGLNSVAAADKALAEKMPNRPIKLDGYTRPLNETPQVEQAWKDTKGTVDKLAAAIDRNKDVEAQRAFKKPYAQLTDKEKSTVAGNIRTNIQKNDPQTDVVLAFWGMSTSIEPAAWPAFKAMAAKYGLTNEDKIVKDVIDSLNKRNR